ncbi:MAG TPA: hypothetical protein EYH35_01965, partial [Thiotrichaceae bacterium]|nr:hypothetical protein [Thiotrichaceae bacterium]
MIDVAKGKPKLNKIKRVSLQQTSILFFSGIAAIVFLALLTYHPQDCVFYKISQPPCDSSLNQNKAGVFGAQLAGLLYSFFGYLAYLVPIGLLVAGWLMFRLPHKKNPKSPNNPNGGINSWISLFGIFLALFSGTGLAAMLWPDANLPHQGGGFLGLIMAKIFGGKFGDTGSILLFISLFFAGITLFADIKWGTIVETIGDGVMTLMEKLIDFDDPNKTATATAGVTATQQELLAKENTIMARTGESLAALGVGATGAWHWLKAKKDTLLKKVDAVSNEAVASSNS